MEPDDNQLQGMDLVKLGPNDSKIGNEYEWNERDNIHTELEIPPFWKTNLLTIDILKGRNKPQYIILDVI